MTRLKMFFCLVRWPAACSIGEAPRVASDPECANPECANPECAMGEIHTFLAGEMTAIDD
jgi:hypothetical protein